jgi:hypothetical protein
MAKQFYTFRPKVEGKMQRESSSSSCLLKGLLCVCMLIICFSFLCYHHLAYPFSVLEYDVADDTFLQNKLLGYYVDEQLRLAKNGRSATDYDPALYCSKVNSVDPKHPLTREECSELIRSPETFIRKRWTRLSDKGDYEKVFKEIDVLNKLMQNEGLAIVLANFLTSERPDIETGIPFPKDLKMAREPLKACDHLCESYQANRLTYRNHREPEYCAEIHSEAFRHVLRIMHGISGTKRRSRTYRFCQQLLHEVADGSIAEDGAGILSITDPDPVECRALALLFRANEFIQEGKRLRHFSAEMVCKTLPR